jgi:hypothetical protein
MAENAQLNISPRLVNAAKFKQVHSISVRRAALSGPRVPAVDQ